MPAPLAVRRYDAWIKWLRSRPVDFPVTAITLDGRSFGRIRRVSPIPDTPPDRSKSFHKKSQKPRSRYQKGT